MNVRVWIARVQQIRHVQAELGPSDPASSGTTHVMLCRGTGVFCASCTVTQGTSGSFPTASTDPLKSPVPCSGSGNRAAVGTYGISSASAADLDMPKSGTNSQEHQMPSGQCSVMEREEMSGESQIMTIILTLEECIREINSILHQANDPKAGRSKEPGNQAHDVNRDSHYV